MFIVITHYRRPDMPAQEWNARYTDDMAKRFVDMRGLLWKIWLDEPVEQLSGAIYLFETKADAEAYVQGPAITRMKENPDLTDVSVRIYDIRERVSELTRAPLGR